ncbi:hypothetical protein TNCV_206141 [Trichonephila clavipes]|nr:hypothetical protein TNCV_206141 [Trichonephila clavipes]
MQPLEDADKNGWTVADFSGMVVEIDLGSSQTGGIDQLSHHLIHLYQPSDVRPTHNIRHGHSQTAHRVKFTLVPTTTPPATDA